MSAIRCAINALYTLICRDPDTAAGGLDPTDTTLHGPGFYRHDRERLEQLPGPGLDRKVQIKWLGTDQWHTYVAPNTGFKMHTDPVMIRIGYYVNDHVNDSLLAMSEDNQQIAKTISRMVNYPTCAVGCVSGFIPASSEVIKLDELRYVLEITVDVQVID
jgi:hypothetical protein